MLKTDALMAEVARNIRKLARSLNPTKTFTPPGSKKRKYTQTELYLVVHDIENYGGPNKGAYGVDSFMRREHPDLTRYFGIKFPVTQ
ncbi:hypothetical protein [Paenibacillus odorifer]|uniref:Uncharacterized protein n=2 Tax=Paenibacillus TaxID=44249 RepID=A0AB36J8Z1_9BACL|nr:hypothetical protein [Paenibacillus odorifer]OME10142.1 hypothetical protein BSK47_31200 [Paenibacillus odorifer]